MEWVLEEFARRSGSFQKRYRLKGFTDSDALVLLGLDTLGGADLYDVSGESLAELASRFDLTVIPSEFNYLLGCESTEYPGI